MTPRRKTINTAEVLNGHVSHSKTILKLCFRNKDWTAPSLSDYKSGEGVNLKTIPSLITDKRKCSGYKGGRYLTAVSCAVTADLTDGLKMAEVSELDYLHHRRRAGKSAKVNFTSRQPACFLWPKNAIKISPSHQNPVSADLFSWTRAFPKKMGIPQQDPEYLRAKYAFIRDLIQFHESRGTGGITCDPKINGKEVDLYLLYQIVTSHGGWEKINLRNEWDKLLEHFHLPRSTNGGIAIKQIYLRYLELYEKIHFLGEDIDAKEDHEDEYEDFRGRRRYPNKFTGHHSSSHHHSSSSHHGHGHQAHQHHPKEISDHNRSQLGLSTRILETSDYEGLLLSLQSPLPNEQDMAISVCTLLSNETKHVLRFSKSPAILNMLLAHAGIYQDCGMRVLMEETYKDARNLNHAEFWDEVLHHPDIRQLLCECFVKGVHSSLGLVDNEGAILSQLQEITDGNLPEEEKFALGTALRLKLAHIRESRERENPPSTPTKEHPPSQNICTNSLTTENDESSPTKETADASASELPTAQVSTEVKEDTPLPQSQTDDVKDSNLSSDSAAPENASTDINLTENKSSESADDDDNNSVCEIEVVKNEPARSSFCCSSCPCQRTILESLMCIGEEEDEESVDRSDQFSIERRLKPCARIRKTSVDECVDGSVTSLLFTKEEMEKVGQRIYQIAHILRNLSFEQDNAFIMARSPTLMRFLLISANCSFGSLAQASFDIIGNIASYIQLEEPLENPLSSMLLTLVTSGIFSEDRFKILRSLEALRELTKMEGNEAVVTRYIEGRFYERICDLLTLSDIMLLIYTLECILSMTGLGEAVCDEIVRVQGSVATLVSLVTVEAQSYGPKGCIQMRVVETVTGAAQQQQQQVQASTPSTQASSISAAAATTTTSVTNLPSNPHHQQTVIHVPPTQHLLQQQLQQPPNPIYASPQVIPGRPSPANSPGMKIVTGTTTVVPPVVVHGQQHSLIQPLQQQQQPNAGVIVQNPTNSQVFNNPSSVPPSNVINQHNPSAQSQLALPSQPVPVYSTSAVVQKPSVLPTSTISSTIITTTTSTGSTNGSIIACVPQGVTAPPPGATVIIQQPKSTINPAVLPPPGGSPVAGTVINGAPTLVTANLPQISNHNLSQHHHVVTPSISLVTPRGTLSEEAWAIAWLKGTFESSSGTSIEQGEIYRMYSAARKNPNVVLSLEQFVQCVKCAYGGNVGPVIKQFGGGTSLSFFEGIKPKISIRTVTATSASQAHLQSSIKVVSSTGASLSAVTNTVTTTHPVPNPIMQVPNMPVPAVLNPVPAAVPTAVITPSTPSQLALPAAPTTQGDEEIQVKVDPIAVNNNNNNNGNINASVTQGTTGATLPVSVHIPSREAKPSLSPILQATLSQPPKAKNNTNVTGSKRVKNLKGKEKQPGKKGVPTTSGAICQTIPTASSKGLLKGNITLSPASSAIRSLLASKVVQRQQNKLQQQAPKSPKGKNNPTTNAISKDDCVGGTHPTLEVVKVNGVGPDGFLDKTEESSASSSVLSSDGSDNVSSNKSNVALTSFHGVLHNGQANLDLKNELNLEGVDDPETLKNRGPMKGMLIDLLERRVPSREPVNGIMTGREIRISEKGLELIDKMEESLGGPTLSNHSSSTCTSNDAQESQKMTFYSSTSDAQVTLQGQASSTACVIPASAVGTVLSSSAVTLASGVAGASSVSSNVLKAEGMVAGQQVKLCGGKFVRVIEQAVGVPTIAVATTTAALPTMATPAVIAEVEVESTDAPIAPAFSIGDGYANSSAATATNGDVTYVVSDNTQSSTVLVEVNSVIATAHSAPLAVDGNIVVVDGGETIIVDGEGTTTTVGIDVDGDIASSVNTADSNISNGGGGGGMDLLEKFSQFSDLIVVPPEQLASLKRPSSPLPTEANPAGRHLPNSDVADDLPPPAKKLAMDSTLMEVTTTTTTDNNNSASLPVAVSAPQQTSIPVPVVTSSAGSVSAIPSPAVSNGNNLMAASNTIVGTGVVTTATPSLPPGAGAQVVQLPLRLSVNPQNPQQLTFTRQLVLPSGQQVLLSTANSQSALQGQVIISKSQGSTSDNMPKAIIILQQTQHQQQAIGNVQGNSQTPQVNQQQTSAIVQATNVQQQQPAAAPSVKPLVHQTGINTQQVVATHPSLNATTSTITCSKPQIVAVQQHPTQQRLPVQANNPSIPGQVQKVPVVQHSQKNVIHQVVHNPKQQPQQQSVVLQQQISHHPSSVPQQPQQHGTVVVKPANYNQLEGVRGSSYPHLTPEQLDVEFPFMCEWAGCGLRFLRPQQVSMHALKTHCPETMVEATKCEWGQNGCDPLLRKRFSLMTHLQDRHCSKQALEMALYRRKNRIDPPPVPQQPLHHPGYAPNAAFHAIKRHAMSFMNTKEHLHDDNEGPVTKSIRLTSALILRNLVNYSALGRRILQGYESHLSGIAMSNVESSRTIAQLLHDMNERPKNLK